MTDTAFAKCDSTTRARSASPAKPRIIIPDGGERRERKRLAAVETDVRGFGALRQPANDVSAHLHANGCAA